MKKSKLFLLTFFSIFCFAANSWLNRFALHSGDSDPVLYSWLRVCSGAGFLIILTLFRGSFEFKKLIHKKYIFGALALNAYLLGFSYAYQNLGAGLGAFVLFSNVQFSLFGLAIFKRQKISTWQSSGLIIALLGLFILVYPTFRRPDFLSVIYMAVAGWAWGLYTYWGKKSMQPLETNAYQFFIACLILGFYLALNVPYKSYNINIYAVQAAVLSGVLCSGVGYAVWYIVLPHLSISTAGLLQLLVPVITFIGSLLFLNESSTWQSYVALFFIITGVAAGVRAQSKSLKD
jgi:drug/metabolite transporter (DMT)-like permease